MGKIFYVMGKSASGKDSLYRNVMNNTALDLKPVILYTTRPMRQGEENGREYYFCDEKHLEQLRQDEKIIEERCYLTVQGPWYYFTADEGQIDLEKHNYLGIGTLESFVKMRDYYGHDAVCPVYIEVEDGLRLTRTILRESRQEKPDYEEVCRRFLADAKDFSEEMLEEAGINRRFSNNGTREELLSIVVDYIEKSLE